MKAKYLSTVSRAWKICAAIWVGAILLSLPIAIVLDVSGYAVEDSGFPRGWGRQLSKGRQHRILPNFPENRMQSKEFECPLRYANVMTSG